MTYGGLDNENAMMRGREKTREKSKRERAADLLNEGRKLAREALREEQEQAALEAEYGKPLKP